VTAPRTHREPAPLELDDVSTDLARSEVLDEVEAAVVGNASR
jgi:hypothetical protein